MRTTRVVVALTGLLLIMAASLPARGLPNNFRTRRMTVNSRGVGADQSSWNVDVSADGRFVVYCSDAENLVPEDENASTDAFVHDRVTGQTRRVSIHSFGTEANEGDPYSGYYALAISGDGRFVAFDSGASDLIEGDNNTLYDMYLHDRNTGRTRRISVGLNGQEPDGHSSYNVDISHDGKFVVFSSDAENLVANDDNGATDVFVYNRITRKIKRVSVRSNGDQADQGIPLQSGLYTVAISPNGRYVVFDSNASDLVANDDNNVYDIFLHDRKTGQTRRVSLANNEDEGDKDSYENADVSADGNLVAFTSDATNLVAADDDPGFADVFVRNIGKGRTERVSVRSNGAEGDSASGIGEGSGYFDTTMRMSSSGRIVAFASDAANLVPNDTLGHRDVFIHDRKTDKTERVSVRTNGDEGADDSGRYGVAMTADGKFVAYASFATNLAPGDQNGSDYDVYMSGPLR